LKFKKISKSFGATQALRDASFSSNSGEISALVGANGALKSILIKIICSYYEDYEGEIYIESQHVYLHSPQVSFRKGLRRLHQIIEKNCRTYDEHY